MSRQQVFVIFEGGGAKGPLHAATLRALSEEGGIDIAGYAGTSAGAFIAALAACGVSHDAIIRIDESSGEPLVGTKLLDIRVADRNVTNPTQLFKPHHWLIIRLLRGLSERPHVARFTRFMVMALIAAPAVYVVGALLSALFGLPEFGAGPHGKVFWLIFVLHLSTLLFFGTLGWIFIFKLKGFATLDRLREALDTLLCKGLGLPETTPVTFGILKQRNIKLRIVTTNITLGRMKVFSSDDPEDASHSVAQVVIASAAIPFLFRPVTIGGQLYCDGGMVSNLPAWVFDAETVNDAEAWIVASNLVGDVNENYDTRRGPGYFIGVLRSALFGADLLSVRSVRNLFTVELATDVKLLDFDYHLFRPKLALNYSILQSAATAQIKLYLVERQRHEAIHKRVREALESAMGQGAGDVGEGRIHSRLRSSLVRCNMPEDRNRSVFHIWHCLGFENCADRFLSLRAEGSMLQDAMQSGQPVFLVLPDERDRFVRIDADGLIWDRTPRDLRWTIAVPLPEAAVHLADDSRPPFSYKQASLAITFDGTLHLEPDSAKSVFVHSLSQIVREVWTSRGAH